MVLRIRIEIQVLFTLSAMVALVKPNGQLEVLVAINLTLDIDFFISSDGRLRFGSDFDYKPYVIGISPAQNNPLPCGGKFELLTPYGSGAVADAYGFEAQYAVREAGDCCLPWDFNVRLLRFSSNGQPEVVQEGFQTEYCLTAVQPPAIEVTFSLAYKDDSAGKIVPVADIYRDEPDTPKERIYFLAANFTLPPNSPRQLKAQIKLDTAKLFVNNAESSQTNLPFPDETFGIRYDKTSAINLSDFFDIKGKLIVPGVFEATYDQDINGADWVAFANAELIPNREEKTAKFVPPGPNVTAHMLPDCNTTDKNYASPQGGCKRYFEVRMEFTDLKLTNLADNKPVSSTQKTKTLSPKVINQETFEEYFRVFSEVRILMDAHSNRGVQGSIGNFTKELIADFPLAQNSISVATLQSKGAILWNKGRTFIEDAYKVNRADDRILYFSRLEAMAALRDIQNRGLNTLTKQELDVFEYYSRGFEKDATGKFIVKFGSTANNVLVTGFDPFQLYFSGLISNTAGLIALGLPPNLEVALGSNPKVTYNIKTAIFPVRFRDFGNEPDVPGLVEEVMQQAVKDCVMIMTCSWTGQQEFRIDRFAAKYRALDASDNEKIKNKKENPVGKGPFYLESTLPYDGTDVVDVGVDKNREVTGPFSPTYLILDQSFKLRKEGTVGGKICKNQPEPTLTKPDSYQRVANTPLGCGEVIEGSGGDYLSNEIFYRTSRVRWLNRALLPTGHLHVPSISTDPYTGGRGARIIDGGKETLESLLKYVPTSPSIIKLEFPDTEINSSGTNLSYSLSLQAQFPFDKVDVSSVEITPNGSPFQLTTSTPITINRGQSAPVNIRFSPTEVKEYAATAKFKAADGSILYTAELKGKGISSSVSIAPVISSFSPTSGTEGTMVSIYGENFRNVSDVRIGDSSVYFTPVSPTEIIAEVTFGVQTGFIFVDTDAGTAQSATLFRIINIRPPRDPYDPYNPQSV